VSQLQSGADLKISPGTKIGLNLGVSKRKKVLIFEFLWLRGVFALAKNRVKIAEFAPFCAPSKKSPYAFNSAIFRANGPKHQATANEFTYDFFGRICVFRKNCNSKAQTVKLLRFCYPIFVAFSRAKSSISAAYSDFAIFAQHKIQKNVKFAKIVKFHKNGPKLTLFTKFAARLQNRRSKPKVIKSLSYSNRNAL
jgi:hypothetical protein